MSRGNLTRSVFEDERDYQRLLEGLEQTVSRFGWDLLSFVLMPNHFRLFLRTPEPNLSRGMQCLVSGYANWHAKRHRRPGHLTQGRFKAALVEDESYFWTVSRYVHLNPVRGKRPLAAHPADWPWSSYPGYARRRNRVGWVAHEAIYAAWQCEMTVADTHTPSIKGSIQIDVDVVGRALIASASPVGIGIVGSDGDTGSWWNPTPKRHTSLASGPG